MAIQIGIRKWDHNPDDLMFREPNLRNGVTICVAANGIDNNAPATRDNITYLTEEQSAEVVKALYAIVKEMLESEK